MLICKVADASMPSVPHQLSPDMAALVRKATATCGAARIFAREVGYLAELIRNFTSTEGGLSISPPNPDDYR